MALVLYPFCYAVRYKSNEHWEAVVACMYANENGGDVTDGVCEH